ncbi:MAG: hypothetical protein ACREBV_01720, partial [Candidatus Zixiibacteriota bacterium]
MAFLVNCSDKQSANDIKKPVSQNSGHIYQDQEPFKGWVRERFQNIVIIHPPEHPHLDKFGDFARIFSTLTRQTCTFFKINPPDSIVIYFYTGVGHGMTVTQRDTPFSDGHVIHFWFPSFYGPPIVKHLLPNWYKGETKHKFLRDGFIALLDASGANYHQATLRFIDSSKFIPLRELAVDSAINVDRERYQSAEAASFVDFVVYAYDIERLK